MLTREEKRKQPAEPDSQPKNFCEEHLVEAIKDCLVQYTNLEL
jgi:hypothetical protein